MVQIDDLNQLIKINNLNHDFFAKKSELIKILIVNFHYDLIVPNTGYAGLWYLRDRHTSRLYQLQNDGKHANI